MIRAFLVDDEEHALNILNILLARTGEVEVVGTASNGYDALDSLRTLRPDVAFLDIEMPGMSGVELAEAIEGEHLDTQVVFVTAYDRYAISAFEQDALDYLLKPLEMDRLTKTVLRIKKEKQKQGLPAASAASEASAGSAASGGTSAGDSASGNSGASRTAGTSGILGASGISGSSAAAAGFPEREGSGKPPVLNVRLMGGVSASAGEERLKWRTGKEKELFALLALRGRERLHRDAILDSLWPDEHYQKAKVYLHTCVSFLRKDLRQLGFEDALKYEGEKYYLQPDLFRTDYGVLLEAVQEARGAGSGDRTEELERAISLYGGPLFKEEDYPWADDEAHHLEQTVGELRTELSKRYEQRGDYARMIESAQKQLSRSPYDEESYRLLMKGYSVMGKHDEVFRVYRQMLGRLNELEIEPSEMTKRLFAEIQAPRGPGSGG